MSGELVTIFGGSGFIGRVLVQHLAKAGYRVRVAVRRPNSALDVKTFGDLGQVHLSQANVRNKASVEAAIKGADHVINLVGLLSESGAQTFNKIHEKGAGIIAEVAAAENVQSLIHMSAIGADAESESKYGRSKAAGEKLVKENFPNATIIRPSVVFGADDNFFNKFAAMAKLFRILPVICGETKFQPVYVADVADAIIAALGNEDAAGKTYEIGGPKEYTFRELLELVNEVTDQNVPLITIPLKMAYFQAFFLGMLPNPMVTIDQLRLMENDNVPADGALTISDLGVEPIPAEAVIPNYLVHHRPMGQFKTVS
ncbi:complex I NDUFA9 subunit family protein [Pseudemcibacter aquimaris]|uniref:complex I NDUFA9 subunit family protein n=1 Tax=Pseudemcibacter aquimaris TaxID=2857064 RepID=UPI002011F1C1|nr:complex I NDUFA9 subunit family protein [Pseudemcibacter aquimaris]MCC3860348.1 complex I NDUFA9 subunit family protein [Pseudemcibacter aquimaris]WDU57674.1 complex I NDUFA9 subunit family protein [Pseudemcibacter aquimaris]